MVFKENNWNSLKCLDFDKNNLSNTTKWYGRRLWCLTQKKHFVIRKRLQKYFQFPIKPFLQGASTGDINRFTNHLPLSIHLNKSLATPLISFASLQALYHHNQTKDFQDILGEHQQYRDCIIPSDLKYIGIIYNYYQQSTYVWTSITIKQNKGSKSFKILSRH